MKIMGWIKKIFARPRKNTIPQTGPVDDDFSKICPWCKHKFVPKFSDYTKDVVHIFDKPERLSTTMAYCPRCRHSFELGYILIKDVVSKEYTGTTGCEKCGWGKYSCPSDVSGKEGYRDRK